MKKLITLFFFLPLIAEAQLTKVDTKDRTIGKVKRGWSECAWLTESIVEGDTSYNIRYRNNAYTEIVDIQSVSFKGWKTVNDLYLALKDAFKKDKGEKATYILGSNTIMVVTDKTFGIKYITVYMTSGGYANFNEKEVDKLFNVK